MTKKTSNKKQTKNSLKPPATLGGKNGVGGNSTT